MLAAVVLVASIAFKTAREQTAADSGLPGAARQALAPWFLWLFAAMVALNSSGALSAVMQQGLGWVSRACLVVAIAALGMRTSFMQPTRAGWRPTALIVIETTWMAALVLALIVWRR